MNNKRLGHVAFGFVAFLFLLLGRLAQLQIIENDEWQRQARSSRLDKDTIPFKRGRILTADQTTIAEDDSVYDLYFRYRDFRRHHLAGQLQASMSLLLPNAPTVDSCFSNAAQHALQLLELLPQHLESLALVSRRDLFYYLKLLFGIEGEGELDKFEEWKQQAELKLSEVFPDALDYFYSRLKFFNLRVSVIESMLGPSWKGTLIAKIEQRRLELELMVLQRSLQDASARALGLSSSELRNRLREEHSRQSSAYFLHRHWQLDGSPEYLAAMLISGDDFASEQLRKQDVSQQLQLLSSLWRKISTSSPQDTAGIYRDQQYRVHRFRVISFAKGIDFKLIDLLAQQGEDFPGLYLQKNTRRVYPNDMNPQIIGMVRLPLAADLDEYRMLNDRFRQLRKMFYRNAEDEAEYRQLRHRLWSATLRPDETRGLSGIEGAFEGALRGVRGYLQVLEGGEDGKDPLELLYSPPTDGRDVVLSLDANLIAIAEKSIQRVYKETIGRMRSTFPSAELSSRFNANLPKVGFALIDLQRPYVPLLATTPDLNREQLRKNYQQLAALKDGSPLRHRALAGNYWPQETPYPGSTFKPLAAVAALLIDQSYWSKEYNCEGSFQANDRGTILRCDTRYGHQQISMRDALKKSCNIYFYKLAREIGAGPIHSLASKLEFGQPTGIEIPELEKGANFLVELDVMQNNQLRLMRTAIGQVGVQASPLQMARFYGWLATGILPSASIIMQGAGASPAVSPQTKVELPAAIRNQINEALGAVSYELGGTAFKTEFPSEWQIVAKTGTAQVALGGQMQPTHAWFTGFFPADNPRYSFAIMCENTGLHGGQIASFILKYFLEQAMPILIPDLNPQEENVR